MTVYLIEAVGANRVKIGYSTAVSSRISSIATACPFPISVLATRKGERDLESALHAHVPTKRVIGEWFEKWNDAVAWFTGFNFTPDTKLRDIKRRDARPDAKRIAKAADVSEAYVRMLFAGKRVASIDVALKIMDETGISLPPIDTIDAFGLKVARVIAAQQEEARRTGRAA